MTEEEAFMAALVASPRDDATRLVFADWLEERGDLRGEFLRLECQLARLPPDCEESSRIRAELARRFAWLPGEWVAAVSRATLAGCHGRHNSFYCPRWTWADLERFPGRDDRRCSECGVRVALTADIEEVRQVGWGVAEYPCVGVDPRVVLSPEAMEPTETTRRAVEFYRAQDYGEDIWDEVDPVEETPPPAGPPEPGAAPDPAT